CQQDYSFPPYSF
nr:immunoglobulin light chain junction region [Macaca mulatta]